MADQPTLESYEALLVLENWALGALGTTCAASSTADTSGDPLTSLTADNLLNEDLSAPWRSGAISSGSTVSVTWTFDRVRPVDWVSIHRSNVRLPWKVELKDALGASLVVSPWTEPIVLASLSDFPWESLLWTLGPDADWLEAATDEFRLDSFITFPVDAYPNVKSVVATFDISTHTNAGRAFLQFALPMIGRRYRPSINMPTGWAMPPVLRSEVVRTETGAKLGRYRRMQRSTNFNLPLLGPESPDAGRIEVFRKILTRFLMTRGDLARVFYWPEPRQRWLFYDTAFVGCIEGPPRPAMTSLEWPGVTDFNLQETN
jgi:hypothetical protein